MPGKLKDMTGRKFGRLTVLRFSHMIGKHSYWVCRCECGNSHTTRSDSLKSGAVKSCGCLNQEAKVIKHGLSRTKIYHVWAAMKNRCTNPNDRNYHHYGGRGIQICDDWLNNFETFYKWAISNGYREGLEIDRIDNEGNYEPGNCKWVSRKDQCNNRRVNRKITFNGKTQTITQWAKETGINENTLYARIVRFNWTLEKALTSPAKSKV